MTILSARIADIYDDVMCVCPFFGKPPQTDGNVHTISWINSSQNNIYNPPQDKHTAFFLVIMTEKMQQRRDIIIIADQKADSCVSGGGCHTRTAVEKKKNQKPL